MVSEVTDTRTTLLLMTTGECGPGYLPTSSSRSLPYTSRCIQRLSEAHGRNSGLHYRLSHPCRRLTDAIRSSISEHEPPLHVSASAPDLLLCSPLLPALHSPLIFSPSDRRRSLPQPHRHYYSPHAYPPCSLVSVSSLPFFCPSRSRLPLGSSGIARHL